MKKCHTCKTFVSFTEKERTARGWCSSEKFTNTRKGTPIDGIYIQFDMEVGENFGCVHHKERIRKSEMAKTIYRNKKDPNKVYKKKGRLQNIWVPAKKKLSKA